MTADEAKRLAAKAALRYLPERGVIGLGSGSTSRYFIEEVVQLVQAGRDLVGVATGEESRALASKGGMTLLEDTGPWQIAMTVDGADEVNEQLDVIKGGGGCQTREKIVNQASDQNIIVVDESKLSKQLGEKWAVPIEVLAFGHEATLQQLSKLGRTQLRLKNGAPWMTDAGNYLYDVELGPIADPRAADALLHSIAGVVETGLFCGRVDRVIVAGSRGVWELLPPG